MSDICGIYKIENKINGHCYIGQSIHIHYRWRQHSRRAFQEDDGEYNYPLYQAFRKYGIENFDFSILEECNREELNTKEISYIKKFDAYNNGYNQTIGGDTSSFVKLTEKQIFEIYDLLLNSKLTQNEIADKYNVHFTTISNINTGMTRYHDGIEYPLRKNYTENFCIDCGALLGDKRSIRCVKCNTFLQRKIKRPNKEELEKALFEINGNFSELGRRYNVCDNTIRKWCKSYGLPFHSKDYQNK